LFESTRVEDGDDGLKIWSMRSRMSLGVDPKRNRGRGKSVMAMGGSSGATRGRGEREQARGWWHDRGWIRFGLG